MPEPDDPITALMAVRERWLARESRRARAELLRDCGCDLGRHYDHLRSLGIDPRLNSPEDPT